MSTVIAEKTKPKTRTNVLIYWVLAAVVIYAIFLYTQPSAPPTTVHRTLRTPSASSTTDNSLNMTPQDLAAHFPRYASVTKRDPFAALIGTQGSSGPFGTGSGVGDADAWQLTGINTVNGVLSALLENSTSGESVFLQPGDSWKGLTVTDIDQSTVHFVNTLGQETTITFAPPKVTEPTASAKAGAIAPVPGLNALPALGAFGAPAAAAGQPAAAPLNPYAGGGFGGGGGGRRGRRGGGGGGFGGFGGG